MHVLAADTDDIDVSKDNASAFVTPTTLARTTSLVLKAKPLLDRNDAYASFEPLDDLVVRAPTFTNVESMHSYILALAHSHFLSANVFMREGVALASAVEGLDALPTWRWDKGAGSTLMGLSDLVGSLSRRFAELTGREEVLLTTLAGLNRHICGQELIHPRERVCPKCLQEDVDQGRLPYLRSLFRARPPLCAMLRTRREAVGIPLSSGR